MITLPQHPTLLFLQSKAYLENDSPDTLLLRLLQRHLTQQSKI